MATATLAEAPVSFGSAHQIDYKWVPIGETFRPEGLQRPMDESHVERIVANFNDAAFGTPIISYRDPGNRGPRGQAYAIVAGQHRIEAAKRIGRTSVYCAVAYGLDAAGEAQLFIDEDKRKRQSALQKFHLARQAGDADSMAVFNAAMVAGYTIPLIKTGNPRNGDIVCVTALLQAYRVGVLGDVLQTITTAFNRDRTGCRTEIVVGLTTVFRYRGSKIDKARLSQKLAALGSSALLQRYRRAIEVASRSVGLAMGNVIVDAYNHNLRTGNGIDMILLSDTNSPGGVANAALHPGRLGKSLAEARAEIATKSRAKVVAA